MSRKLDWDFNFKFDISKLWESGILKKDLLELIKLFEKMENTFKKKYGEDEWYELENVLYNLSGFEPEGENLNELEYIIIDLYDWCDYNKRVWLND